MYSRLTYTGLSHFPHPSIPPPLIIHSPSTMPPISIPSHNPSIISPITPLQSLLCHPSDKTTYSHQQTRLLGVKGSLVSPPGGRFSDSSLQSNPRKKSQFSEPSRARMLASCGVPAPELRARCTRGCRRPAADSICCRPGTLGFVRSRIVPGLGLGPAERRGGDED